MSKLISIMLGILFLASCGEHTELEQPIVNDGETVAVTKEIQISVLPMQSVGGGSTRSASDKPEADEAITVTYRDAATTRAQDGIVDMTAAESKINNAYIVQFNGTSPTSTAAWVSEDVKSQLSSGSGAAITCSFVMTAGIANRVYVIANRATTPTKGMTLAAFEAPVTLAVSTSVPATGLPMSAMQDVTAEVGAHFGVFQLRSLLAKLNFGIEVHDYPQGLFNDCSSTWKLKGVSSGYSFYAPEPGDFAVRPEGMLYTDVVVEELYTYYVPANLSGRNHSLTYAYQRAVSAAPANSFYMEADVQFFNWGNGSDEPVDEAVFNLLLGDSSASDFNFVSGCSYFVYAYVYDTSDKDLRVVRK